MFILAVEEAGLKDSKFFSDVSASLPSYDEKNISK